MLISFHGFALSSPNKGSGKIGFSSIAKVVKIN
jgi:hypothetical protein